MTALTAAAARAIIDIEPENLLRMIDLRLPCSMLLSAVTSRQPRMITVFGVARLGRPRRDWETTMNLPLIRL
jgi:hypothetical protein